MNRLIKTVSYAVLGFSAFAIQAAPQYLVTHNKTNEVSKAYVAGTLPPHHPAPPGDSKVTWVEVKLACFKHTEGDLCPALVKMELKNGQLVELGTVKVNLVTGVISPERLSAAGYVLTYNSPGDTTITYANP